MTLIDELFADLSAESLDLRAVVAELDEDGWRTPTPAVGWEVATQIAHLAWTDAAVVAAATDRAGWDRLVELALADPAHFVDRAATELAGLPPDGLLGLWDEGRAELEAALRGLAPGERLAWFGPAMSPASMVTARIMETWAHGLDVRDALGVPVVPTDRIRHVCHLAVRTRDFAFGARRLAVPAGEFRVELTGPSGALWTWGPEDAEQRVSGSAYEFARLAAQRIHRADTSLRAGGPEAARWLDIVQAFAGPAGAGRAPRG
ncbi:MAG: TIGR03084 family metal-binding protein [Nocardioides sp.]|uniref:TIGR03084 family metal-binding protein n=1 Tax=Nocardioides sp. TaxID=35761 RepID=UPI0039E6317C